MDGSFSISTEQLIEKGHEIAKESEIIKQALLDIDEARKSLEGWVSTNKDRYENKMTAIMPKMKEMTEAIDSYSRVAIETAERAMEVENKIAKAIEEGIF